MANTPTPTPTKSNRNPRRDYTADAVIPLLLAAHNMSTINYKGMAALDTEGRTESAFEHKFREWRAAAKELHEAHERKVNGDRTGEFETGCESQKDEKKLAATKAAKEAKVPSKKRSAPKEPADVEMNGRKATKKPRSLVRKEPTKAPTLGEQAIATAYGAAGEHDDSRDESSHPPKEGIPMDVKKERLPFGGFRKTGNTDNKDKATRQKPKGKGRNLKHMAEADSKDKVKVKEEVEEDGDTFDEEELQQMEFE
jgi:hypothetical protein